MIMSHTLKVLDKCSAILHLTPCWDCLVLKLRKQAGLTLKKKMFAASENNSLVSTQLELIWYDQTKDCFN